MIVRRRDFIATWLTNRLEELGWELQEVPELSDLVIIHPKSSIIQVQEISESVVSSIFVDVGVVSGYSPSRASAWAAMYVEEFVRDMHQAGFECN